MDLYILRHGKAQDHGHPMGDHARDLTVVGAREVERIGDSMKALGINLDIVVTSPLIRAKRTAMIVTERMNLKKPVEWDELKPEMNLSLLYRRLSDIGVSSRILLVGHEPQLSELISDVMTGRKESYLNVILKKPGLAKLSMRVVTPNRLEGDLLWLIPPKILRMISK